jgi:anti-sigma factor RsiW
MIFRRRREALPALTCKELVELVTAYVEEALPDSDRARFEAHLELCDGCATYVQQIRETTRLAGTLSEETLAPEARDALLQEFRNWKESSA